MHNVKVTSTRPTCRNGRTTSSGVKRRRGRPHTPARVSSQRRSCELWQWRLFPAPTKSFPRWVKSLPLLALAPSRYRCINLILVSGRRYSELTSVNSCWVLQNFPPPRISLSNIHTFPCFPLVSRHCRITASKMYLGSGEVFLSVRRKGVFTEEATL